MPDLSETCSKCNLLMLDANPNPNPHLQCLPKVFFIITRS